MTFESGTSETGFDFSPKAMSYLLVRLREPSKLGNLPAAKLPAVSQEITRFQLVDSRENRGLVLAGIVEGIILDRFGRDELQPREHQAWAVIYMRFVLDKSVAEVEEELHIGRRQITRCRHRGLVELGKQLIQTLMSDS